jgi:hypothetical protein
MRTTGKPKCVGKFRVQVIPNPKDQGFQERSPLAASPTKSPHHAIQDCRSEACPAISKTAVRDSGSLREKDPARTSPIVRRLPCYAQEGSSRHRPGMSGHNDREPSPCGNLRAIGRARSNQGKGISPSPSPHGRGVRACYPLHPCHAFRRQSKGCRGQDFHVPTQRQECQEKCGRNGGQPGMRRSIPVPEGDCGGGKKQSTDYQEKKLPASRAADRRQVETHGQNDRASLKRRKLHGFHEKNTAITSPQRLHKRDER